MEITIERMLSEKTGKLIIVDLHKNRLSMFTTFGCTIADIKITKKMLSKLDKLIEKCAPVIKEKVEMCSTLNDLLGKINEKRDFIRDRGFSAYRFLADSGIYYTGYDVYYDGVSFVYQYNKLDKKFVLREVINTDERSDIIFTQNVYEGYKRIRNDIEELLELEAQYIKLKMEFDVMTSFDCQ